MPMAKKPREDNLAKINELGRFKLSEAIITDLRNMRSVTHVRVHDSGDFFAKWYYRAWVEVARALPHVTFYAYTKSLPFLDWDSHPKNFRVTQSLGGRRDGDIDYTKPHARIFATEQERRRAGYSDGNKSDLPAILGQTRIGLVYHGTRNLTEENLVRLQVA